LGKMSHECVNFDRTDVWIVRTQSLVRNLTCQTSRSVCQIMLHLPLWPLASVALAAGTQQNLIFNGGLDSGLTGWTVNGTVEVIAFGGWSTPAYAQLSPASGSTAQLSRVVAGLKPSTRYTIATRVRTTDRLSPPIVAIRSGAQIDKAHGWVATGNEDQWLERRFEVFTKPDATSLEIVLQAWQTDLDVTIDFDDVRLYEGRIDGPPPVDPSADPWLEPPTVADAPVAGENIVVNGDFANESDGWSLGLNAEFVDEGGPAMRLTSTADTSRCAQPIPLTLPPNTNWTITCQAKVDPGVIASMYIESAGGFSSSIPISNTQWATVTLPVSTVDDWVDSPTLKLENWKNQPGSAWYRNITWTATGTEWSPTTTIEPIPQTATLYETFDNGLDTNRWLLSNKAWGGDNGGVTPENVSIVDDTDNGQAIKALRLTAHGDLYDGDVVANGRSTRVGAAVATREYYASGQYTVRAKVAPTLGAVTAFWPFHYIDHQPGEAEYWHEPNPRRNTEIDWEFPTDLTGTGEDQAAEYGLDPTTIAFTNARTNAWGGQFGGEGGEHKGRIVLRGADNQIVDLTNDYAAGVYHDYTIEWHSGALVDGDGGDARDDVGCVRWYFDDVLVDELLDEEYGQGNVPFRGARFWLGIWFAASGYGDEVGWGGSPDFNTTATYIASVTIEPFNDPRDTWTRETVPNLAWATPDEYPTSTCTYDLDHDADIDMFDLLLLLGNWNEHNIDGLLQLLQGWGACSEA
jgi:hypothetical protein